MRTKESASGVWSGVESVPLFYWPTGNREAKLLVLSKFFWVALKDPSLSNQEIVLRASVLDPDPGFFITLKFKKKMFSSFLYQ